MYFNEPFTSCKHCKQARMTTVSDQVDFKTIFSKTKSTQKDDLIINVCIQQQQNRTELKGEKQTIL